MADEQTKTGTGATITYEQFAALDLRVGVIEEAKKVEGATKLIQLLVSIGAEKRTLVAGIADNYAPENLPGKKIVVLANLAPRVIRGIESQGMLLAADFENKAVILTIDGEAIAGTKIR